MVAVCCFVRWFLRWHWLPLGAARDTLPFGTFRCASQLETRPLRASLSLGVALSELLGFWGVRANCESCYSPEALLRGAARNKSCLLVPFHAASPSQESQFKDHVALGAVISDLLLGLFAWSLNHAQGTRVEIAAKFEPAAAHEAFPRLLTWTLVLRAHPQRSAAAVRGHFAARSRSCAFGDLLRDSLRFLTRPPRPSEKME